MRLNPYATRPAAYEAVRSLTPVLAGGPLERPLRALVEVRVSQVNGCGFCLALHSDMARAAGVEQVKLDTLAGWREDRLYTDRERAALELAEVVTSLPDGGVPDAIWATAAEAFSDDELADLLYLIGQMNLFNRLNIATRFPAELWREQGLDGLLETAVPSPKPEPA